MHWHVVFGVVRAWLLVLAAMPTFAQTNLEDIPAPLKPWIPWVLHDVRDHACPYFFNAPARHCIWPGRLQVEATAKHGAFTVDVEVFQTSWVPLPGRPGLWPQAVTVSDAPVVVVLHEGVPAVELAAGRHRITGSFDWPTLPETLPVPPDYGLVSLTIDGQAVAVPNEQGQLWLRPEQAVAPSAEQDRLELQVYRKLVDEQPFQVLTQLELDVAGAPREVTLAGVQLPDTLPMALDSALPARLDAGDLRLQVRPGHWTVRLTTRHLTPVAELALPALPAPWPAEEIWVFEARPALRLVELSGAVAIDPRQTQLPAEWQALPAYRIKVGERLQMQVLRRGDPDPEPDRLGLIRELWLDFDGGGMTVNDVMTGQMTREWRLQAGPRLALGRVALNGEPQFVTTLDGEQRGVEVRRGAVELNADSRLSGDLRHFPAVGWAQDVNSLAVNLNLPPGWRLWAARGVDNVPATWLHRWTLLDLFLVLIATIAVARLWHWRWAVFALVTLAALWHEAGAPRQVWLHLLAALALLRVLPTGRLRQWVAAYRNAGLLVLLATSVLFMVNHLRIGLYPQLEYPYQVAGLTTDKVAPASATMEMEAPAAVVSDAQQSVETELAMSQPTRKLAALAERGDDAASSSVHRDYDPSVRVQTGPGLPNWHWTAVQLSWNGPVASTQQLELVLLSPIMNLCLALLRVLLLTGLIGLFLHASFGPFHGSPTAPTTRATVAMLATLLILGMGAGLARAALPDQALLESLKQRLLLAPACLPNCAEIPRAHAELQADALTVQLEVNATEAIGLPLPGRADQWLPHTVLLDDAPVTALWRAGDGVLWLVLPAGVHRLVLLGSVPARASFELPFQLVPQRATANVTGWSVAGLRPDGSVESQMIFTRLAAPHGAELEALEARSLPAFFKVIRTLRLGLDWRIETRVQRLTPPGIAAALQVPVLLDESVTTPEVRVEQGMVTANFAADQTEFSWESVLSRRADLTLTAPATTEWTETWRVDISPIWHAEITGIPVVHHQSERGEWLPEWRPLPAESVTLKLTRPAGVPGQTLTIDRSRLQLLPGRRATDATLELAIRSSQGGQHAMTLPAHAVLQTISINGTPQPIRQDVRTLTLPIAPGEQQIMLTWRSDTALGTHFATPAFSLGTPSVNAALSVRLPEDRWILALGGPQLGPAVLFWGVLLVIVLVAIGLGRTRLTPLAAWQWGLLAIGLSQTTMVNALIVVGWLFALALRARLPVGVSKMQFNLVQIGLALLTLVALSMLFQAIQQGLLGAPNMQIAGNGSSAYELNWFQDRADDAYPVAWVWSVSLWFYRGLMLVWALWLAVALLSWLRWGWSAYSRDGVWRSVQLRGIRAAAPSVETRDAT